MRPTQMRPFMNVPVVMTAARHRNVMPKYVRTPVTCMVTDLIQSPCLNATISSLHACKGKQAHACTRMRAQRTLSLGPGSRSMSTCMLHPLRQFFDMLLTLIVVLIVLTQDAAARLLMCRNVHAAHLVVWPELDVDGHALTDVQVGSALQQPPHLTRILQLVCLRAQRPHRRPLWIGAKLSPISEVYRFLSKREILM